MYSTMSKFYSEIFPLNPDKISFALKCTSNQKPTHTLDIGCSTGDLAIQLAQQGHQVTGIDLDHSMIEVAKEKKAKNSINHLEFLEVNMLDIEKYFPSQYFNQIMCFGNTLVHLTETNDIYAFFQQIYHLLKSEGIFKGQILNYSHILKTKPQNLPMIETDSILFQRNYNYQDNNIITFHTILKNKMSGQIYEGSTTLLALPLDLLEELLLKAGFSQIKYYSNFKLEPYHKDSFHLVFEAYK